MKRFLLFISISFFLSASSYANHITGGQMYYTYLSQSVNSSGVIIYKYHVTLNLYRDCNAPAGSAPLDDVAPIAIYDKSTGTRVWSEGVTRLTIVTLNLGSPNPCITNPPVVCYQVGYYETDVDLPGSPSGYTVVYQRCCRIAGINNLSGSNSVGATYTADIPGTNLLATAPENSSAKFIGADTVIVCANNAFIYSFAAQDKDNDQLVYSFCDAYTGGSVGNASPNPPVAPPYSQVPYVSPYSSSSPLGSGVTLNTSTGLISGIAPDAGIYVVTVCVTELRNGITIATQRKDLQIKVGDCNVARALLNPQYITCDGFTMGFQNLSNSPLINTYFWDFGVTTSTTDTSNLATPTFTYPDTGVYILKLVTNRNQQCSDSTTAIVKVYPGFFPAFNVTGACYTNPLQFTDATSTMYGVVDSWNWNFGDPSTNADTSHLQNPVWKYPTAGPIDVALTVSNSKGCIKTIQQTISVIDKPPITLAFRDTLICVPDAVQLNASGNGIFSWSPTTNMTNSNTATPTVNPTSTTWYVVNLDDSGCKNSDSVKVRVVRVVSLVARGDTTICLTDGVQLGATTDGLQFLWTPAGTLNNAAIVNPIATPISTTVYQVLARIGSCTATDDVKITTVPYPYSNAGNDTMICYNTSAQLKGAYIGSSFSWSPVNYLNNANITNPIAKPPRTISFVFTVYDTIGCPKPGIDTVIITVLPKVRAFAGRDTSVVVGQELQLNGSGGITYLWSPPTGLNNIAIPDPIGIYGPEIDSIRYKLLVTDQAGCADSAYVLVKIFKTNPSVFVPTAFTPNNDGLNDVVRPIAVGIQQIKYFSIYNRWGQMVFTTTENEKGWDGKIAGRPQNSGVFVWMVSAIDYTGKPIFLKGTVALIR
jgi:gliding motility-associated-like protein